MFKQIQSRAGMPTVLAIALLIAPLLLIRLWRTHPPTIPRWFVRVLSDVCVPTTRADEIHASVERADLE